MPKRKRNACRVKLVYQCTYYDVRGDCIYRNPKYGGAGCIYMDHETADDDECHNNTARRAARRAKA